MGDDEDEVGVHIEGGEDDVDQDDADALPKLANPTSSCHLAWSIDFTTRATSSQCFQFPLYDYHGFDRKCKKHNL